MEIVMTGDKYFYHLFYLELSI